VNIKARMQFIEIDKMRIRISFYFYSGIKNKGKCDNRLRVIR